MKVYKFRGNFDRDIDMVFENKLYASTYDNLNDPFEGLFNNKEDLELINIFKQFGNTSKEYDELIQKLSEVGIYSLSKNIDNEILWSLYSDSHRGFAIEYDLDKLIEDFNFNKDIPLVSIVNVQYTDHPPKSNIIENAIKRKHDLTPLLGTKSIPWKNENELRLVFEMTGLIEHHPGAIKSIVFGLRTSEDNIFKTMNLLKGRGLQYFKIESEQNLYKLKKVSIEDKFKDYKAIDNTDSIIIKFDIPIEYSSYKDLVSNEFKKIVKLPNIKEIYSMHIEKSLNPPQMRVFASTNFKLLPLRYFEYEIKEGRLFKVN
ncbi:DUF2971 domain-containing protein [Elizabethkingia miricola]|uniref:DUF2971 domain-containing protein n=4 Tax=Elizabethkingia miricola TaxID=172045 RepID=UPI001374903A|nr:DUF2971 domain-containing protein [Elizabethkingia miricola]NHQ70673.1 DUF2971 domain-containing protein [Elizabethkingia miricola]QHQ87982.1 DUF2971 domain-containing protein [Elizabethkingia miricola]UIO95509.1 DUF2971 domain-containing protein [Elizabethkingia miricola]WER12297.1 DUF2971 domain-containing protein [Elizabethkingia miricola]WGL72473.1 DUF2971 domain-containing protein [Elizabethkingia miricola]